MSMHELDALVAAAFGRGAAPAPCRCRGCGGAQEAPGNKLICQEGFNPRSIVQGWRGPVALEDLLANKDSGAPAWRPFTTVGQAIYRVTFPGNRRYVGMVVRNSIARRMHQHFVSGASAAPSIASRQRQRHGSLRGVTVEAAILNPNVTLSPRELHIVESLLQSCTGVMDWASIRNTWTFDE